MKFGKNVNGTYALLSEALGGKAMKKSSIFEWYKRFKESLHVKITNEDNIRQGYCSL